VLTQKKDDKKITMRKYCKRTAEAVEIIKTEGRKLMQNRISGLQGRVPVAEQRILICLTTACKINSNHSGVQ
jgi:hypothetical protein